MDNLRSEKDILWFQITVYQSRLLKYRQGVQQLDGKSLHELHTQPLESILLNQFVKAAGQELEYQTQVTAVDERVS